MNTPIANAGTTLEISASLPSTYDKAGYDALAWTQVRGVRIIGDIGRQYRTSEYQSFDMPIPVQKKYGLTGGSNNIEIIRISDAGQDMLVAAVDGGSHSFRVKTPDGLTFCFVADANSVLSGVGDASAAGDRKIAISYTRPPIEI